MSFASEASHASGRVDQEIWVSERVSQGGLTLVEEERRSRGRGRFSGARHYVRLDPIPSKALWLTKGEHARPGVPLQVGVPRDLPLLETPAALRSVLNWQALSDGGRAAQLQLTSPEAQALRLGLLVSRLPPDLELRFFSPDEARAFVVSGEEILRRMERKAEREGLEKEPEQAGYMYWSPVIEGDTIIVEFHLPPGANTKEMEMGVPQLSHLWLSPGTALFGTVGAAAACQVDVVCDDEWRGCKC